MIHEVNWMRMRMKFMKSASAFFAFLLRCPPDDDEINQEFMDRWEKSIANSAIRDMINLRVQHRF